MTSAVRPGRLLATASLLSLLAVAGCGGLRPDHGDGAAATLATQGAGGGAPEGDPQNARNLGTPGSTIIPLGP